MRLPSDQADEPTLHFRPGHAIDVEQWAEEQFGQPFTLVAVIDVLGEQPLIQGDVGDAVGHEGNHRVRIAGGEGSY